MPGHGQKRDLSGLKCVIENFPHFIMVVVPTQLRSRVWALPFIGDRHHEFFETVIYQLRHPDPDFGPARETTCSPMAMVS
jgi:hypothetical protein